MVWLPNHMNLTNMVPHLLAQVPAMTGAIYQEKADNVDHFAGMLEEVNLALVHDHLWI